MTDFLTIQAIAAEEQVSERTIARWRKKNADFPPPIAPRRAIFRRSDYQEWREKHREAAA